MHKMKIPQILTLIPTSVIACIRIDSRFHAETVYVVGNRFHSVRETFLVGEHDSVVVTFAEEAIVYVDIVVARILQTFFYHKVGLMFNNVFTNIYSESIPGTPTHDRRSDCLLILRMSHLSLCATETQQRECCCRQNVESVLHDIIG